MAIFQPSQVVPDVRSGLGLGVIDATGDLVVSWRIQGPSALASFSITIYENDENSTQVYTTGQITTGCPAYGTTSAGVPQFFSYTIPAATLSSASIVNGKQYKLVIKQWWNNDDSVTQSSASVFLTRAKPTLSIAAIGTSGVIDTRFYTFTGNYSQAQGDTLNWFRWQIGYEEDNPFYDSGYITGTGDIACYYDGFFTGESYVIKLMVQTENGVAAETAWKRFECQYDVGDAQGLTAGCVVGTDAVVVDWGDAGIVGQPTGTKRYGITSKNELFINSVTTILFDKVGANPMSFANPWTVVFKIRRFVGYNDSDNPVFLRIGQASGDITFEFNQDNRYIVWKKGGTTLHGLSVHGTQNFTVILTYNHIYIREDANMNYNASFGMTYTQEPITAVELGTDSLGASTWSYIEVIQGAASSSLIAQAYTYGTYVPAVTDDDYMMADWTRGLNAGVIMSQYENLEGFVLYRRNGDVNSPLVKIADVPNSVYRVYDYGALSQKGPYIYYLFPADSTTYTTEPYVSSGVMPCWWNWTLMECKETADKRIFTVQKSFRFRLNIETSAMVNNNKPSILPNFTRYPTVQLAPQNYKSSSLSGLIGVVDYSNGQPVYVDTTDWREQVYALSTSQNPLFLKSRKGDLFRIRISGDISMQTADATKEQVQTFTIPWVEVGSTENVSLYSTLFAGVQENEGAYTPQYYVDTYAATAEADDVRLSKTGYNNNGKVVGDAFRVEGHTLILPTPGGSPAGTSVWYNTADADATAADIALGDTLYVKGELVTGTADTHIEDHTLYVPDGWISFSGGE